MPISPVGRPIEALDTPALLIDLDALDANVARMAGHLRQRGMAWRPHAKAFKTPALAHRLIAAGAIGLTVAKVSEAEVMVAGGVRDLLLAHLIADPHKADRLAALQLQARVIATVDHPRHVELLAGAAGRFGVTIPVVVDLDIGLGRCGARSVAALVELARLVHQTDSLALQGLMGYEGQAMTIADPEAKRSAVDQAIGTLRQGRAALEAAGLPCPIASAGGSGTYQITADLPGPTELQAGGGIFACGYYTGPCGVVGHVPALTLLARVVSRPEPELAILDAGKKAISDHLAPPRLPGFPEARMTNLVAEHLCVAGPAGALPGLGDLVHVIPGYSDLTFVLHDRVTAHRAGLVVAEWPLWGRGKLE